MTLTSEKFQSQLNALRKNVRAVVHGKNDIVDLCIAALLARGHVLLEDVPGVGKSTLAGTIAQSIDSAFQRIQFTSDMLPSDILGVTIFDPQKREFEFRPGPIFANVVLADEINRTTPKTQSALLEAMNTSQITLDGHSRNLPAPFLVLATQNPVEFHGTYPLPKSQMDRFLMRLHLGYPDHEAEIQVLREQHRSATPDAVKPILTPTEVVAMQDFTAAIKVADELLDYIVRIAEATRTNPRIELGCSTRGALALRRSAQGVAALAGRSFVTPDDIKRVAVPVLAHRVQVARTYETTGFARRDDEETIARLLADVAVPV